MKVKSFLVLLLILVLTGCGASSSGHVPTPTSAAVPNRLHISFVGHASQDKTVNIEALVQKLYNKVLSLPQVDPHRFCIAIAREQYQLTFLENEKPLLHVFADRSGCGSLTLSKKDVRQTDDAFWFQLNQALSTSAGS